MHFRHIFFLPVQLWVFLAFASWCDICSNQNQQTCVLVRWRTMQKNKRKWMSIIEGRGLRLSVFGSSTPLYLLSPTKCVKPLKAVVYQKTKLLFTFHSLDAAHKKLLGCPWVSSAVPFWLLCWFEDKGIHTHYVQSCGKTKADTISFQRLANALPFRTGVACARGNHLLFQDLLNRRLPR